jgi:hypothetical protein
MDFGLPVTFFFCVNPEKIIQGAERSIRLAAVINAWVLGWFLNSQFQRGEQFGALFCVSLGGAHYQIIVAALVTQAVQGVLVEIAATRAFPGWGGPVASCRVHCYHPFKMSKQAMSMINRAMQMR